MALNVKSKPFTFDSFSLGMGGMKPLPNASKYDNKPSKEEIKNFVKNRSKIVDPIVISSLKKHPEDVLHGSRSLSMLLPDFRKPGDWDLYSPIEKERALSFEKSLDNKVKADIAQTVPVKLKSSPFQEEVSGVENLYRVVVPKSGEESEIDVLEKPEGLKIIKKKGITHESLETQYEKLEKQKGMLMRMIKSKKDRNYIQDYWSTKGFVPKPKSKSKNKFNDKKWMTPSVGFSTMLPKPAWKDTDKDSIPDLFDCRPLDATKQGVLHDIFMNVKQMGSDTVYNAKDLGFITKEKAEDKIKREEQLMKEEIKKQSADVPKTKEVPFRKQTEMMKRLQRTKQLAESFTFHMFYRDENGVWQFKESFYDNMKDEVFYPDPNRDYYYAKGNWEKLVGTMKSEGFDIHLQKGGDPNKILAELRKQDSFIRKNVRIPNLKWKTGIKPTLENIGQQAKGTIFGQEANPEEGLEEVKGVLSSAGETFGAEGGRYGPSGKPRMSVPAWGSMTGAPQMTSEQRAAISPGPPRPLKQIITNDQYQSYLQQGYSPEDLATQGIVNVRSSYYQDQSPFGRGVAPYRPISYNQSFMTKRPQKEAWVQRVQSGQPVESYKPPVFGAGTFGNREQTERKPFSVCFFNPITHSCRPFAVNKPFSRREAV